MGDEWILKNKSQKECFKRFLDGLPEGETYHLKIKKNKGTRSNSLNSTYWWWLTHLADHFSKQGAKFSREDMHDLMRHQHLGYADHTVGHTVIKQQLISTTSLDNSEMSHYMKKIDAWAADHGCLLPIPGGSEYEKYKEAQA